MRHALRITIVLLTRSRQPQECRGRVEGLTDLLAPVPLIKCLIAVLISYYNKALLT